MKKILCLVICLTSNIISSNGNIESMFFSTPLPSLGSSHTQRNTGLQYKVIHVGLPAYTMRQGKTGPFRNISSMGPVKLDGTAAVCRETCWQMQQVGSVGWLYNKVLNVRQRLTVGSSLETATDTYAGIALTPLAKALAVTVVAAGAAYYIKNYVLSKKVTASSTN